MTTQLQPVSSSVEIRVDISRTPVRWQFTIFVCDSDPNCSETPAIVGEDGFDFWSRRLDLDDSSGRWDSGWGASSPHRTCDSAIVDAVVAVHRPTSFTYIFVDDVCGSPRAATQVSHTVVDATVPGGKARPMRRSERRLRLLART